MKLLSHGENSDLLVHCREVAEGADNEEERIMLCFHDIGKATVEWQSYIRKQRHDSPHPHAAAGGLLAALFLRRLGKSPMRVLTALHVDAAHHSELNLLTPTMWKGIEIIAADSQAQAFYSDSVSGLASLLPPYPLDVYDEVWKTFRQTANSLSQEREDLRRFLSSTNNEERLRAYLDSRKILGKLCFNDNESAAGQSSGDFSKMRSCRTAFDHKKFCPRHRKIFPAGSNRLFELRTNLRKALLQTVENDGVFTFVDAPTGMGKTEAMLQGAEKIRQRINGDRIIFAVPQVSIADQIFEDYLKDSGSSQIWNYRRREKNSESSDSEIFSNASDQFSLAKEEHPFSESYNVTTFNQVLLAIAHPNRKRCITGLGLCNAVIVMDEFHKLPLTILPLFFPLARAYAERANCRFLLGSATPFQPFEYFDLSDSIRIDSAITGPLYRDTVIDRRRSYFSMGFLTLDQLENEIDTFHEKQPDSNLLVVVNLVGQASWPMRRKRRGGYQPWLEFEALEQTGNERVEVFLDGLTPPCLRREIIVKCREVMRARRHPVTMITTQMIEVGVDLDFDAAMVDYQGLAATIQRGGRVGREGRGDEPCQVGVFSLRTESDKTTYSILSEVHANDIHSQINAFKSAFQYAKKFDLKEERFFAKWNPENHYSDAGLTDELTKIQTNVYEEKKPEKWWLDLFQIDTVNLNELGASFELAHYIAELSGEDFNDSAVVVDSQDVALELKMIDEKIRENRSSREERQHYLRLLADYKISFSPNLRSELNFGTLFCKLENPELLNVYIISAVIL